MTGFGYFILLQQLKKSSFNADIIVRHVFVWWLSTASIRVLGNVFLAVLHMHRFHSEWAVLHERICSRLCLGVIHSCWPNRGARAMRMLVALPVSMQAACVRVCACVCTCAGL